MSSFKHVQSRLALRLTIFTIDRKETNLFLPLRFLANVVPANNEPAKVMGKAVFFGVHIHLDRDFRTP